ncbi:unnamed protein product [Candida verbasci]|uniref:Uncharacterized protein n=1 Tax=Candida verbasci TaxID=1227364 RepID=A0A9W4U066_9ASCO|nr:unnamed protein product [Candida verbasci]
MQGSYNNNGLPRPYYMKPSKKKSSPYSNMKEPIVFFNTPRRKLIGYLVMFCLFGTLMYWISQDLKDGPDPVYEIVKPESSENKQHNPDLINIENSQSNNKKMINSIDVSKVDKEGENIDLAGNLAQGSNGEKGLGVNEAPKGGIANEAPIVGSDEDKLIGTGKGNKQIINKEKILVGHPPSGKEGSEKGYKIDIEDPPKKISNENRVQQIIKNSQ